MRTAIEQRGVAVIVLPGDIALHEGPEAAPAWSHSSPPSIVPAQADLDRLADLLNGTEAVTMLCGSGTAGAHDEVVALADVLGAPVVHALRGKPFVEWDNPFDVGMTGLIGFSSGYHAMESCDALLMLGTDFPYRPFYPGKASILQIDWKGSQLGRRAPLTLGLVGTVRETIQALLPRLQRKGNRDFLERARAHYATARKALDELATPSAPGRPIHPQYLARMIDEAATDDAIFTADVGTPTLWAARYLTMNGKRQLHGSFNHARWPMRCPRHSVRRQRIPAGKWCPCPAMAGCRC